MEEQRSINPFDAIFKDLRFIKNEVAEIKHALANATHRERNFYSLREAALKLGVCYATLYRNVHAGKIPSKKIGSRIMIPGSYIDRL